MSEQNYLKPEKINSFWQQVAAERRGSNLGYSQAEMDAVPKDMSEDAHLRGTTFNAVIIDEYEPKPETPKVVEFKPELAADQFFVDAATAIDDLNAAGEKFQAEYLQPNTRLLDARAKVEELKNALREAEQELAEIEAEGSSTDRFQRSIETAQTILRGLSQRAVAIVKNQLQIQKLGRVLHQERLTASIKDELNLHVRPAEILTGVDTFQLAPELPRDAKEDVLKARAAKVVANIDLLATNLHADQAQHNAK
jgi:hypothetical protein